MKFTWCKKIIDNAQQNWVRIEEIKLEEYFKILDTDEISAKWDK